MPSIKAGLVWSLTAEGKQGGFGPKCIRGGNWVIEVKSDLLVLECQPSGQSF